MPIRLSKNKIKNLLLSPTLSNSCTNFFLYDFLFDFYSDVLYKATRRPPPLSLLPQFGIAPLVLEEMGARCFQKPGYEADDVMASLSDWARRRGFHVVLISGDKDMLQLVGSAVFVLNPSAKDMALTGTHEIFEKYQVQAHQLADFYALVGDAADNIPGVRGLGPKGASTLLRYFGNLESIISKLALPNKGVDVLCVDALTTAGIQHELLPEKKPRASKVSTTSVSASSLSEKARFRIQFDVEVVRYITECFAQDGARGSPIALVEKLVRTGADDLRKYLSLVRLRSYLLPELMTTGRYAQKQTQEFRHTALSVEEIPSDSNLNMSYCHYRGEREHTAMNNLLAISPMLRKPLQMLRKQKIESDLKTM